MYKKIIILIILTLVILHNESFSWEFPTEEKCVSLEFKTDYMYLKDTPDSELAQGQYNAFHCGKYFEAVTYNTELIKRHPDDFWLYAARAQAKSALGDQTGAINDYKKQLSMNSEYKTPDRIANINFKIGFQYVSLHIKDFNVEYAQKAIPYFTEAIKNKPKYPEAFEWRGRCKYIVGDKTSNLQMINSGIQDLEYAKEQYLQLGYMSDYKKAIETYNEHLTYKQEYLKKHGLSK